MDQENEILLIADEMGYLYIYNLISLWLIGKKKFKENISEIHFSKNNWLFFVVSGRFVFIYERP